MTPQEIIKRKKDRISLQKIWYKKLKKRGFNDIEILGGDGEMLHDMKDSGRFNTFDEGITYPEWPRLQQDILSEYYEAANKLLQTPNVFKSSKDQCVWEFHCGGMDGAKIAKSLNCSKQSISRKIIKYRKLLN